MNPKIFVISGPSGVGKGTIVKALVDQLKPSAEKIITYTTRKPRATDIAQDIHKYVTKKEFEKLIKAGEILEYNFYNENYYGTPKTPIEKCLKKGKNVLLEIDVNGGLNIKKKYPNTILIFLTAEMKDIESRIRKRGQNTEEEIQARLKTAKNEFRLASKYDYIVENPEGHPEKAINQVLKIIKEKSI